MPDLQALIDIISANLRQKQGAVLSEKTYSDEPILQTASHMSNYTPPRITEMRKIANSYEAYFKPDTWLFYEQAKYMEDYTDDFAWDGEFTRYYPTYQSMNNQQLRGYFSWRTKVRQGDIQPTSLSFAFVYVYELLQLIGVSSAEEGFHALKNFWEIYRQYDPNIDRYLKGWLRDYMVYYGLDPNLLKSMPEAELDEAVCTVLNASSHSESELFSALCFLSAYEPRKGRLYKQYPKELEHVVCRVFFAFSDYYVEYRMRTLCEKLFGYRASLTYNMFNGAVFYEASPHRDAEYELNGIQRFACKKGIWYFNGYPAIMKRNQDIGVMLKTVDCLLRQKLNVAPLQLPDKATKYLTQIAEKEIEQFLKAQRLAAAPKIEIDLSKLGEIRATADRTRNKLITEEEAVEVASTPQNAIPKPAPKPQENSYGLTNDEYCMLYHLLYGGEEKPADTQRKIMPSLLADSINEKLFDRFSDTVIVFEDDKPVLLEDYKEELKGMIGQ